MNQQKDSLRKVPFKAGDVVKHTALNERWLIAVVDDNLNGVYCFGWPCSFAYFSELSLVESCPPEDEISVLRMWARDRYQNDPRGRLARRVLDSRSEKWEA